MQGEGVSFNGAEQATLTPSSGSDAPAMLLAEWSSNCINRSKDCREIFQFASSFARPCLKPVTGAADLIFGVEYIQRPP